ncbi:hypothetical protein BASA81_001793 [Batrachochytrium salamandrivorans]|nr:hypothetical protein BASA81_001793 [Batrachochytrium salamandrivorans]
MFRSLVTSSVSAQGLAQVKLSKPVMGLKFWDQFKTTMQTLGEDPKVRCILVSGQHKSFSFGLDLKDQVQMDVILSPDTISAAPQDAARRAFQLNKFISELQSSLTSMEETNQPVVALVHEFCFGGGMDLVCCADVRWCTQDAKFAIKEVDVGMAPDLGTLQRMERLVGSSSLVRELAFTGRIMHSAEAKACGFVSRVFSTKDEMLVEAQKFGEEICSKSPVAITGIKRNLNFARDAASLWELNGH